MYVVTVRFDVRPERFDEFMPLMIDNARLSLEREPGCRTFDVCASPQGEAVVFLYEVYDDDAAFEAHLASDHFKSFDAATASMVTGKAVGLWRREDAR